MGRLGWQTHAVSNGTGLMRLDARYTPITARADRLRWLADGRHAPGETVVVAAASGPVGSLVGQIARIKGARAVGIAGGQAKCAFARGELGFDAVIDHRAPDFADQLAAACAMGASAPERLWPHPRLRTYRSVQRSRPERPRPPPSNYAGDPHAESHSTRLHLAGVRGKRNAFVDDVSTWIAEGRVRHREDIVQRLEKAPEAFIGMLQGRNFGKLLVDVGASG